LSLAGEVGRSLELIVSDSFLGELQAAELETLWPMRSIATPETMEAVRSAWDAFRAPDPVALAETAPVEPPGLPFLSAALLRLLEELPAPSDGLSGTERRALRSIADGASTPPAAFVASQRQEAARFLGDSWFYRVLVSLGRGSSRLVETWAGEELPDPPPLGDPHAFARLPLRLTRQGRLVLDGEADRVGLLELDRWLGGTHLTADNVWRWDPATRELTR
jgi:hypothetical protein